MPARSDAAVAAADSPTGVTAPSAVMTEWVKTQKAADNFFVLDECELRDTHEDGGIIRCKRQDLTSDEIQLHLSTGKVVTQLSLAWQDKLSFVLDDKLVVKVVNYSILGNDEKYREWEETVEDLQVVRGNR